MRCNEVIKCYAVGDLLCKWGQWRSQHTAVTAALAHPDDDAIKQVCFWPKFKTEYSRRQRAAF